MLSGIQTAVGPIKDAQFDVMALPPFFSQRNHSTKFDIVAWSGVASRVSLYFLHRLCWAWLFGLKHWELCTSIAGYLSQRAQEEAAGLRLLVLGEGRFPEKRSPIEYSFPRTTSTILFDRLQTAWGELCEEAMISGGERRSSQRTYTKASLKYCVNSCSLAELHRQSWSMDSIARWPEQKKVLPDSRILSPSLPPEEHVGTRRTAYIVADMRLIVELLVETNHSFSYCTVHLASF